MRTPSIPSLGHTQFPNGETPVLSREDYNTLTGAQAQYHRVGTPVLEGIGGTTGKRSKSTVGTRHAVSEKQSYHIKQTDTAPCPYNEQNNTLTNN